MRGTEGAGIVATPLQAFQGEFLLRTGKQDTGRPMLEEVVRKARALPGPDAWTQTLFTIEAIARAARDVGDWDFAALGGAADARARSELRGHARRARAGRRT